MVEKIIKFPTKCKVSDSDKLDSDIHKSTMGFDSEKAANDEERKLIAWNMYNSILGDIKDGNFNDEQARVIFQALRDNYMLSPEDSFVSRWSIKPARTHEGVDDIENILRAIKSKIFDNHKAKMMTQKIDLLYNISRGK